MILCRIEHFEQRARRVTTKIRADFVDLVEHKNRIARAAAAQLLNDPARHRADVSAAMSADFRFITHPAETNPHKLAAESVGDGLTEAGLANARRPEKTKDRAVSLRIEFSYGQIFDQPLLNFFKIEVIAIQDLLRLIEVEIVLAQFVPWQIGNNLYVTHDHRKLGTCRRNEIQPLQFALRLFHHCFRRIGFLQANAQLLCLFFAAAFGLTQLVLDRFKLRTQISAPLRIGELRRNIFLQSLLDLRDLKLRRNVFLYRTHPFFDVEFFEQRLLLRDLYIEVRR